MLLLNNETSIITDVLMVVPCLQDLLLGELQLLFLLLLVLTVKMVLQKIYHQ